MGPALETQVSPPPTGPREHRKSPLAWEKQAVEEGPNHLQPVTLALLRESQPPMCARPVLSPKRLKFYPPLQNSGSTEYPGFLCKG